MWKYMVTIQGLFTKAVPTKNSKDEKVIHTHGKPIYGCYLELLHGRIYTDQKMKGWGRNGPVFGPFDWYHTTYGNIRFGGPDDDGCEMYVVNGLMYYDDVYYGDWTVFAADELPDEYKSRLTTYDEAKALPPDEAWDTSLLYLS